MKRTKNKLLSDFFEYLLSVFFPNRCAFCNEICAPFVHICDKCIDTLPRIEENVCPKCGFGKKICNCSAHNGLIIDGTCSPFYYKDSVREAIRRLKFQNDKLVFKAFGDEMIKTVRKRHPDIHFDIVTYVPMMGKNKREREYNQSALLAEYVAKGIGAEYIPSLIKKLYATENQRNLSWIERKGNLLGVFDIDKNYDIKDKNILLCDDVRTTGATISECGKMLFLADAKSVYSVTAAIAVRDKNYTKDMH